MWPRLPSLPVCLALCLCLAACSSEEVPQQAQPQQSTDQQDVVANDVMGQEEGGESGDDRGREGSATVPEGVQFALEDLERRMQNVEAGEDSGFVATLTSPAALWGMSALLLALVVTLGVLGRLAKGELKRDVEQMARDLAYNLNHKRDQERQAEERRWEEVTAASQQMREHLESLWGRVESLDRNLSRFREEQIGGPQVGSGEHVPHAMSHGAHPPPESTAHSQKGPNSPLDSLKQPGRDREYPEEALIDDYNRAVSSPNRNREFETGHSPDRVGIEDGEKRINNPSTPIRFVRDGNGEYLLVSASDPLLFPRPNLRLSQHTFMSSAITEAFDCGSYDPHGTYEIEAVEKPAMLRKLDGERWDLERRGHIRLRPYSGARG